TFLSCSASILLDSSGNTSRSLNAFINETWESVYRIYKLANAKLPNNGATL
ncbi:26697_t:CDS:1, partial [Dentiscutata erythropus]